MFEIPFIDKINILVKMIKSSYLFWIIIGAFIVLITMLFIFKKHRKLVFLIYILTFTGGMILLSHSQFVKFLDYFVEVLFNMIYFPNFCLYTLLFVIINIVMLWSINSKKILEVNKKVIIVFYSIITFLFILVINTLLNSDIDLQSKLSIYSNKNLLAIIELSTFIMTLLYIYLFVGFILKKLLKVNNKSVEANEKEVKQLSKVELIEIVPNVDNSLKDINKFITNLKNQNAGLQEVNNNDFYETSKKLVNLYSKV